MWKARVLGVAALVTILGCSGGGDGGGGTGPESVFTSLTIAPSNPTVSRGATTTLTATAMDQSNKPMSGLQVSYTSGNTAIATVTNAGVVTGVAVGSAQITATGVIGTVTKTQQVTVAVTAPTATAAVNATAGQRFEPSTVVITPNGTVSWTFAIQHNVTFEGTPPPGGNIPNTSSGTVSRTFPTVGTYNYQCTIHAGMSGQVKVES